MKKTLASVLPVLWIKDHKPGDNTGDGVNKVWHVGAR